MDPGGKEDGKKLGKAQREETIIIMYYMRKNAVFNKRKSK